MGRGRSSIRSHERVHALVRFITDRLGSCETDLLACGPLANRFDAEIGSSRRPGNHSDDNVSVVAPETVLNGINFRRYLCVHPKIG